MDKAREHVYLLLLLCKPFPTTLGERKKLRKVNQGRISKTEGKTRQGKKIKKNLIVTAQRQIESHALPAEISYFENMFRLPETGNLQNLPLLLSHDYHAGKRKTKARVGTNVSIGKFNYLAFKRKDEQTLRWVHMHT